MCSLASFKLSTLGVRHPRHIPSLLDCYSTDIRAAWCFCSCELPCSELSVFQSTVLRRSHIWFQLWTALT